MSQDSPFECPICYNHYADVEPTSFPCGHSCCLEDAKLPSMNGKCHMCREPIPSADKLVVNFALRDGAIYDRTRESLKAVTLSTSSNPPPSVVSNSAPKKNKKKKNKSKKSGSNVDGVVPAVVTDDTHLNDDSDDEEDETTVASANTKVNPKSFPKYNLKFYPVSSGFDATESVNQSNLEIIFNKSRNGMADTYRHCFEENCTNWKDILLHAVEAHANKKASRFLIQDSESTPSSEALVFDIVELKQCPKQLLHKSLLKKNEKDSLDAEDRNLFPLLVVRYNFTTAAMIQAGDRDMLNELKRSKHERKVISIKVKKEVISEALKCLNDNHKLLSREYVSAYHRDKDIKVLWTPSFILPLPIDSHEMKSVEGRCSLEGCSAIGFAICGKCKSAQYCSREHQMEHWKVHKKVCGKTHTELAPDAAANGPDGPSVVIPLDSNAHGLPHQMLMNFSTGLSKNKGDLQRNIHGDGKFLIKVQLGFNRGPVPHASRTSVMTIYDETRSFQAMISQDLQPQHRLVNDAVFRLGISQPERNGTADRLKGYMYAKREGNNLRIFLEQFAPLQNW